MKKRVRVDTVTNGLLRECGLDKAFERQYTGALPTKVCRFCGVIFYAADNFG